MRSPRVPRLRTALAIGAVALTLAACSLLSRDAHFEESTLTDTQARQAATSLATALDDLAARFLVADPTTENLHVLRWEDNPESATDRLSEHLGLVGGAAAFARATAGELLRTANGTASNDADDDARHDRVAKVETRVADVEAIGSDGLHADWLRVDIVQDETYENGETASTATTYGLAVREGSIVEVRDLPGLLSGSATGSAAPVVRQFATAVLRGDEAAVDRHTDDETTDQELVGLRAWLAAAGGFEVAELPASQLGSAQVAYLVPERGPLVRFVVTLGGGHRGAALVTWEVVGGQ